MKENISIYNAFQSSKKSYFKSVLICCIGSGRAIQTGGSADGRQSVENVSCTPGARFSMLQAHCECFQNLQVTGIFSRPLQSNHELMKSIDPFLRDIEEENFISYGCGEGAETLVLIDCEHLEMIEVATDQALIQISENIVNIFSQDIHGTLFLMIQSL